MSDANKPGVLLSRSDIEISDTSQRDYVITLLSKLIEEVVSQHHLVLRGTASAGHDDRTIELELEIEGQSFHEAEGVTKNIVASLAQQISDRSPQAGTSETELEPTAQTLIPA